MGHFAPSDPSDVHATGFANANTGRVFAGRAMSFRVSKNLYPITDQGSDPRRLEENFRSIVDRFRAYEGGTPELYQVARWFGGAYITGTVAAASGDDGDTHFTHDLGRVPKWVITLMDLAGTGGQIQAVPSGRQGAIGANENAWTKTDVFVRATLTSQYAFVVI